MRPITTSSCSSACSWRQLLLLDEAAELALRHLARLVEAGIDELLVDVLEDDGDLGGGDRLRDLATHGSGADDGGLEDEQVRLLSLW